MIHGDAGLSQNIESTTAPPRPSEEPIAIVGMSCRLPGARDLDAFWQLLCNGQDATREAPPGRFPLQPSVAASPVARGQCATSRGGFLEEEDVHGLDTLFFGISSREAERMDPQQRLLLELAYHAVEDAGISVDSLLGSQTGVYVGVCYNEYSDLAIQDPVDFDLYKVVGTSRGVIAGRLSYTLGLCGPSLSIDTACSSSLVALHLACQSLRRRECKLALCAGANLILHPVTTIGFSQAGMIAPDGRCKSFSAAANGFVRSDGLGAIVLKPLAEAQRDGDRIYAVVRGSAVNSDGRTNGLLITPSQPGQVALLQAAYSAAGVPPASVSYVEAHGTGTPVGDPVEAGALGAVLGPGRDPAAPCRLGSVKSNIGHTEAAAGIAGIIKTALCLYHRRLVPSLHCQQPNPAIDWERLRLTMQRKLEPWPSAESGPRVAGVSAFGIGGTNAHAVLVEAPGQPPVPPAHRAAPYLLLLSAMSKDALRELAGCYRARLLRCAEDELFALCASAGRRRAHHAERLSAVGSSPQELAARLEEFLTGQQTQLSYRGRAAAERPQIAFLFSGQGSQWFGMARSLLAQEPIFRAAILACDQALRRHGFSELLPTLKADGPDVLDRIDTVQPVLFAIQVALAALWRSLGIQPDVVIGHSMGEVAAACVAQALSLEDAALVICTRSRLLLSQRGQGAMAAVELSVEQTEHALQDFAGQLSVAVSSSPTSTVVSGDGAAIDELLRRMEARGVFCRLIKVDVASHSPQMDPLLPSLQEALAGLAPRAAQVPMLSTVLARPVQGGELTAGYWSANLRQPVLMAAAVTQLAANGIRCFIELSPHPLLANAVAQCLSAAGRPGLILPSLRRERPELDELLGSLGALYCHGISEMIPRLYPELLPYVPLPSYPFQHEHISRAVAPSSSRRPALAHSADHPLLGTPVSLAPLPEVRLWQLDADHPLQGSFADHKVLDEIVMPGAAIADLALASAAEALECWPPSMAQLEFKTALILPAARPPRLQIAITRAKDQPRSVIFQLYSAVGPAADWTLHARAELSDVSDEPPVLPAAAELSALQASFGAVGGSGGESGATHYEAMARAGISYGPGYRGIEKLWRTRSAALACLTQLPAAGAHRINPGLLDSCLQLLVAAAAYGGSASGPFLPLGIQQLRVFGSPAAGRWAYAELYEAAADAPGDHRGDVRLLGEAGQVLVELRGVHIRQLARRRPDSVIHFFAPGWRATQPAVEKSRPPAGGRWIIMSDAGGVGTALAEQLRQRGAACAQVVAAAADSGEFQLASDGLCAIDMSNPANLARLLAELDAPDQPLRGVIHLHSLDLPPEQTRLDLAAAPDLAPCRSALQLIQALVSAEPGRAPPQLFLVTRGAQSTHAAESAEPVQALLWGFGAALTHEHPGLVVRRIDLERGGAATAAHQLAQEILAPDAERELALRGETRLGMRLVQLDLPPAGPEPLNAEATYLITGGLGGLGLTTARWLVDQGARHLLLLGRSAPSAEAEQSVQELRARGVQVRTAQADVADEDDVRRALAGLQEGPHPLRGIIHAAAVLADSTLIHLTEAQLKTVLAAKAVGALHLHRLTAELPLDFFILFSSVTSVLGGPGQASYAAANALLDALAQHRRAHGLPGLSVNWGAWAQVGLAARQNVLDRLEARGVLAMQPADAIAPLGGWMHSGRAQVAVCALDVERWLTAVPGASSARLWSELRPQSAESGIATEPATLQARLQILRAPTAERRAVTESVIRKSLAMVLKIGASRLREIEADLPLVRIGLDSLMALELRNLLEASVGVTAPLALILHAGTSIARLADHLLGELPESEAEDVEDQWEEGSV